MPVIRLKEARDMSSEERRRRVTELHTELVRLKTMTEAGGSIDDPARIKQLRKAIARILTVERETELAKVGEAKKG
ncbi:MAG TPA: 50S ribosomal protein L29 [Candidatus Paceibacterota bacterium]|jgi:large subunit ribosomal protein L29|nr:50S ribosomal protein L29 [Candidatus Paceibacterota bacterium]